MRCINPVRIRGGKLGLVPCGKCNFCLVTKRNAWSFRLANELKDSSSALFLTMTYSDDHVPVSEHGELQLNMRDVQLFKKRLRKRQAVTAPNSRIRYYTVGEYGTVTDRPHYHSIMFNLDYSLLDELPKAWAKGHVYVGDVTPASIHYVTKYVIEKAGKDFRKGSGHFP